MKELEIGEQNRRYGQSKEMMGKMYGELVGKEKRGLGRGDWGLGKMRLCAVRCMVELVEKGGKGRGSKLRIGDKV